MDQLQKKLQLVDGFYNAAGSILENYSLAKTHYENDFEQSELQALDNHSGQIILGMSALSMARMKITEFDLTPNSLKEASEQLYSAISALNTYLTPYAEAAKITADENLSRMQYFASKMYFEDIPVFEEAVTAQHEQIIAAPSVIL